MGRLTDLKTLRAALQTSRAVLVRGPGGIGKTQLLLRALASVETGRRIVWIDVERFASAEGVYSALQVLLKDGSGPEGPDTLADRLDALHACVVLDGIEQISGPSLEDIDDLLAELKGRTANTQFVATSQVDLQRTLFDRKLSLTRLGVRPSRELLRTLVPDGTALDVDSESGLLAFVEGHPLAVRLTAALVGYIGSGRAALEQIQKHGAAMIELPKRTKQDRKTSLSVCLSLAYEMLEYDEQRLLYLIASCPGGIFTHQLELEDHSGTAALCLLAAVRRWSLVQTTDLGQPFERSNMLSPIRSYVALRWRAEHTPEAQALTQMLLNNFAIMAAVIDQRAQDPAEIPFMLARFSQELPNLLRVFDEAEAQPGNADLSLFVSGICSALMRFFFILRLPEQGAHVMQRGAKIALRDGKMKAAIGHIVQMVALAGRSEDTSVDAAAESLLEQIPADDPEISGNVALARAIMASSGGDAHATEIHARVAISHFEMVRKGLGAKVGDRMENADSDSIGNDLSGSYGKLGDALLAQNRFEEARTAYKVSLDLLCGASIAVNEGQILHQIGNCVSNLGKHTEAADNYRQAAVRFQAIGMREYLSNALSELGYTLIKLDDDTALPDALPLEVLTDGLDDVAEHVARCFATLPGLNPEACATAIRKLFGVIIVLSLSDDAQRLGSVAHLLKEQVIKPLAERVAEDGVEIGGSFTLNQLDALVALTLSITSFERKAEMNGTVQESGIEELAKACVYGDSWSGPQTCSLDWLVVYLRRKWLLQDVTANSLNALLTAD